MLGEDIDTNLQLYIKKMRESGRAVSAYNPLLQQLVGLFLTSITPC